MTKEVLTLFILISNNSPQLLNINDISLTFEVSKCDKSILVAWFVFLNIPLNVSGTEL